VSLQAQAENLVRSGYEITVKTVILLKKIKEPGIVFVLNQEEPIISASTGQFVGTKRRGFGLPGGKMHDNELPTEGAIREVGHETGLAITVEDRDLLHVILSGDNHAKIYYNGRDAKATNQSGWVDHSRDKDFDPVPVEQAVVVPVEEIVALYESGKEARIAAKEDSRMYPVYKSDLFVAYVRAKMFLEQGL